MLMPPISFTSTPVLIVISISETESECYRFLLPKYLCSCKIENIIARKTKVLFLNCFKRRHHKTCSQTHTVVAFYKHYTVLNSIVVL